MSLHVNGKLLGEDNQSLENLENFLQQFEEYFKARNDWLKSQSVRQVFAADQSLYVNQREVASAGPLHEHVTSFGTDMMTTCHAAVLHCPETKATSLAHFDGKSTDEGVQLMFETVEAISNHMRGKSKGRKYELHLVGGFEDERNLSEELTMDLLSSFATLQADSENNDVIDLKTFCCTSLNQHLVYKGSSLIKSPIVFGLGVTIATGEIHPAVFMNEAKQPAPYMRGAKTLHGPSAMKNIYDWRSGEIVHEPFSYSPFPSVGLWLSLPDEMIREHMSTSPEVEPDNFEDDIRAALRFILDNPDPMQTIFKDNEPLRFKKVGFEWRQSKP